MSITLIALVVGSSAVVSGLVTLAFHLYRARRDARERAEVEGARAPRPGGVPRRTGPWGEIAWLWERVGAMEQEHAATLAAYGGKFRRFRRELFTSRLESRRYMLLYEGLILHAKQLEATLRLQFPDAYDKQQTTIEALVATIEAKSREYDQRKWDEFERDETRARERDDDRPVPGDLPRDPGRAARGG